MDMRHLSHLLALADERHFGRAAQRVHLSQPAFSRSIQALERSSGQRLFDRETGDIRPTPAGAFLIERARRILLDMRSLQRDVKLYADARLGDTAFGVGPLPAATLMPQVLPELRRAHPGVQLRVEINNWQLLLDRLRVEDIEFFVADVRALPKDATLQVQPLGRQRAGFFVRPGHPLAARPCTLAELWACGVATTRVPTALLGALAKALRLPEDQLPPLALECDDVALLRAVVTGTDTVLGVSQAAVHDDLEAGRLLALAVKDGPALHVEMGVVSLRQRSLSPMASRAVEVLARVARTLNTTSPTARTSRR
jgi:DNA-binding transcriptional LysR family regulator